MRFLRPANISLAVRLEVVLATGGGKLVVEAAAGSEGNVTTTAVAAIDAVGPQAETTGAEALGKAVAKVRRVQEIGSVPAAA